MYASAVGGISFRLARSRAWSSVMSFSCRCNCSISRRALSTFAFSARASFSAFLTASLTTGWLRKKRMVLSSLLVSVTLLPTSFSSTTSSVAVLPAATFSSKR